MYNYIGTQDSLYDTTKLAIHSFMRTEVDFITNCYHIFKKTVTLDDILQFTDEEKIVTDEDSDSVLLSSLKLLQESERSTEDGKTFPDTVKNPTSFQVTINITVAFISKLIVNMTIQSGPEKQVKNQISEKKFFNVLAFDFKISQRIRK